MGSKYFRVAQVSHVHHVCGVLRGRLLLISLKSFVRYVDMKGQSRKMAQLI